MKKFIWLIVAIILVGCLIQATGCSKTSNSTGHVYVKVDASTKFTQPYEAIVTLSQSQTISQQDGLVYDTRVFDMGNVPTGHYTLSYRAYRTVNNSPIAPIYNNSQDFEVVGGDQSITVHPH